MNIINIVFIIVLYIGSSNSQDTDLKEAFFRHLRFHDSPQEVRRIESKNFENIPQPGRFNLQQRKKRSYYVLPSVDIISHFVINKKIPLYRIKREINHSKNLRQGNDKVFVINDLIRFKRNLIKNTNGQNLRNKQEQDDKNFNEGSERETRGATKEQWIKQQYPVDRPSINDNIPSASTNTNTNVHVNTADNMRAPRVNFVTTQKQRHPEPPVPLSFRDREGRSRERDLPLYPIYQQQYPYSSPYPQSHPYYAQEPRARNYEPSYRPPRYYDPYEQRFDDQDRGRRYGYSMEPFPFDDGRQQQNKQRRIIYYATLPEIVKNPYYRSQIQSQKHSEYNGSTVSTSNQDQNKTPLFPVKVSTDVNVRESHKNPERRYYTETDTRFTYKLSENDNF